MTESATDRTSDGAAAFAPTAGSMSNRHGSERIFVLAFLGVSLVGPLLAGECFPFSIAPMFCQQPTVYCRYRVTDPTGDALPLERFALQRVYDGNPVGLGCGIRPADTRDEFGKVPTVEEVVAHLRSRDQAWEELPYVDVRVEVIGDLNGRQVGVDEARSFSVRVTAPERSE